MIILLRYDPAIGQLVDAEGKPIGVVCVPKVIEIGAFYRYTFEVTKPDLTAATVRIPPRARTAQHDTESRTWDMGFNAALDAIK